MKPARPSEPFGLLPRPANADKSRFGHALIVAGSRNMPGAAALAVQAALASGAGLTTAALPVELEKQSRLVPAEAMRLWWGREDAARRILAFIQQRRVNSCVIGPGLGLAGATQTMVRALVRAAAVPLVLDADGLNALAGRADKLVRRSAPLVLTPHAAECARLFAVRVPSDRAGRAALAKKISQLYHGVLVLKGPSTVVAENGKLYVNASGNPGLAKGGSGDVLAGMIGAFIAQGLGPYRAACWAVYLHGRAADLAVKRTSQLGLTASKLIEYLPKSFLLE